MQDFMRERALELGKYIQDTSATVRQTAAKYGIAKSTVHKDVTERLAMYAPTLAASVKMVLEQNKAERHIRGGQATKQKYENRRQ